MVDVEIQALISMESLRAQTTTLLGSSYVIFRILFLAAIADSEFSPW